MPFGHDHRGDQIHFHAAVLLGYKNGREAEFRRFAEDATGDAGLLMLDRFEVRRDFFVPELFGGPRDGAMLFGEVFRREDCGPCDPRRKEAALASSLYDFRRCRLHPGLLRRTWSPCRSARSGASSRAKSWQ